MMRMKQTFVAASMKVLVLNCSTNGGNESKSTGEAGIGSRFIAGGIDQGEGHDLLCRQCDLRFGFV